MIQFQLTLDDFLAAQKTHIGRVWYMYLGILYIIVCVFFLAIQPGGWAEQDWGSNLLVMAALAILLLAIAPMALKRKLKKLFAEHKRLQELTTLSYDEQQVEWKTPSGSYRLAWSNVARFKRGRGVILIYESKRLMRIIPERSLAEADIAAIMERLEQGCSPR